MAKLEFDVTRTFRKIATDVVYTYVETCDATTLALCFYYHKAPALQRWGMSDYT